MALRNPPVLWRSFTALNTFRKQQRLWDDSYCRRRTFAGPLLPGLMPMSAAMDWWEVLSQTWFLTWYRVLSPCLLLANPSNTEISEVNAEKKVLPSYFWSNPVSWKSCICNILLIDNSKCFKRHVMPTKLHFCQFKEIILTLKMLIDTLSHLLSFISALEIGYLFIWVFKFVYCYFTAIGP